MSKNKGKKEATNKNDGKVYVLRINHKYEEVVDVYNPEDYGITEFNEELGWRTEEDGTLDVFRGVNPDEYGTDEVSVAAYPRGSWERVSDVLPS